MRFALRSVRILLVLAACSVAAPRPAAAASSSAPPPLPAPAGTIVRVATESELQAAVRNLRSNTTILIAPGTYTLSSTLTVRGTLSDVAIRGASGERADVVLVGRGMTNASYGAVRFGISASGAVQRLLIANLTVRDTFSHAIVFNAGVENPRVYNVRLLDAGEQLLKSNPDGAGGGVDYGRVEYSAFEYSTTAPSTYTNGVDVHTGAGWAIRHNLFRNIRVSSGALTGPALIVWNRSRNTTAEGNLFVNCSRGIAYGLQVRTYDHRGGVIRNNMVFRAAGVAGDVGISVADSPDTKVLNNTVYLSGTYGTPIEYRFSATQNVVIANNLLDGIALARDGARASLSRNLTVTADFFVDAAKGDLHLRASALSAIDRGSANASVVNDWDLEARPVGSANDIGADEYGGNPVSYVISGRVGDQSGSAVAGVSIALSGARNQTVSSDANGRYSFSQLAPGGTYTVTPSMSAFDFSPSDAFVASLGADTSLDFVAVPQPLPPPPPPPAGAPAIDATASGALSTASSTRVTTTAFSTVYASELLLAFVAGDDPTGAGVVVTGVSGAGLTWELVRRTNVQRGTSEIWRAFAPAPLSGAAVTATLSQAVAASVTVVSFSGVDTSGTNGSGAIGATGSGNASSGAPIASLTTTRANSWVVGVGNDFDNPIARTAAAGQVLVYEYMPSVGDTYWVQRTGAPIDASGTRVDISDTAPTTDRYNLTICEVLAPGTSAPSDPPAPPPAAPSVAVTSPAGGASFIAPASIAVAASASAAAGLTIAKVDFLSGDVVIGSDSSAPYSASWTNVAAGTYSVSAVAIDSLGVSTRSSAITVTVSLAPPTPGPLPTGRIQPEDVTYLGAFRVQENWKPNYATLEYSNAPIAYYPNGDPTSADAFPGSLFIGGHTYAGNVKEIRIPTPVISKTLASLPVATELQPFVDVTAGLGSKPGGAFIMGMTYVPSQDRILFTYSGDYSDTSADCDPAGMGGGLGWFSPSRSGQAGLWYLANGSSRLHPYTSLRYIMEIPQDWADANLQGNYLATGRHRGWCPEGTNLYASAPWSTGTPAAGSNVAATTLMQFGDFDEPARWSREHSSANAYQGGAWLTAGSNAAQVITGIVDYDPAHSYYGYANWASPNQCEPSGTCVGSRGWRAADPRAAVLFYDPQDLAAVANGTKPSWEVQWYAKLDIEPYMLRNYAPTYLTTGADAETLLATFDRQNGYLYVSESFADGVKPVVHVFKVSKP